MGGISELVGALALLGIMRAWDAREEERKSRQEEVFVPFKLSPLPSGDTSDQPTANSRRVPCCRGKACLSGQFNAITKERWLVRVITRARDGSDNLSKTRAFPNLHRIYKRWCAG
jgi:hypothetical protein